MAGDLGRRDTEVHQRARAVLDFWLREVPPERRFARDDALDATIRDRFADDVADVAGSHAAGWRATPKGLLAAIILLDQFSRNLNRGSAAAFANDPLARALTGEAIAKGWGAAMEATERQFLYMPLMHSERLDDQVRSLPLFAMAGQEAFDFALRHAAQIARLDRFPGRNAALGRVTTAEETRLLDDPHERF